MRRALVMIGLTCLLAAPLLAQTSTGRHRRATVEQPEPAVDEPSDRGSGWYVMPAGGLITSGDLIRIRTVAGGDQTWDPPGGSEFTSEEFVLTLDESIALSVAVGRRLGRNWWLRLDVGAGQLPMTALARVGESADAYRWDELSVLMAGLSAEFRLMDQPSYFFLLGGPAVTMVSGDAIASYDQTCLAVRLGGGYNLELGQGWSLRGEILDTIQSLDLDDYQPPVPEGAPVPGVVVEDLGPQHFVELLLGLHGSF